MPTFIWKTPTARKQHRCGLCGRWIGPGEKYHRMAGLGDGTAWTMRECRHCQVVKAIALAAIWEDEYDDDLIGEWEPETISELRLKALWRKRWRRADGTLYPDLGEF